MNTIRPVSDLRNNFADISRTVHETAQPVFLTRNGYGAFFQKGCRISRHPFLNKRASACQSVKPPTQTNPGRWYRSYIFFQLP